jgi:hypothetical protein
VRVPRLRAYHLSLLLILTCICAAAQNDPDADKPTANPGRPTISTPAELTPVGYLQFETGVLWARKSPEFSSRTGIEETIKLAFTKRLELLVSAEPFVHSTAAGPVQNSAGDVFVGAQAVVHHGEGSQPAIAVSYFHHVRSSTAPDLDIGTAEDSLLLLISADVRGFHYDLNGFFNRAKQLPASRLQTGQSLSVSHQLRKPFGLTGELWHFTQPFQSAHAVGTLWAISFTPRKNLVLDAGFDRGLTSTSTKWELFAGFTYLLPQRLWKK